MNKKYLKIFGNISGICFGIVSANYIFFGRFYNYVAFSALWFLGMAILSAVWEEEK